jgi:hypothetical protein
MGTEILQSDLEIYKDLLSSVERTITGDGQRQRIIECGPLEVNAFSICFWASLIGPAGRNEVYIKIPQVIFHEKEKANLRSFSGEDVKLAEDEYESLSYLSRHWDGTDIDVRFITPLGFIRKFNAIITKRIMARDFFLRYRKSDLSRRLLGRGRPDPVLEAMSRLGEALARFHKKSHGVALCDGSRILEKVHNYLFKLRGYGVNTAYLDDIARRLGALGELKLTSRRAVNLKGIDIRQVFIDQNSGLYILDPGKMKDGFREIDLARFVVTCRILYWGTSAILFRLTPSTDYEESFLTAYRQSNDISEMALQVLLVKELFKHWIMAHASLEKRRWTRGYKVFLKKVYTDPFYKQQISVELSKWEASVGLRT